MTGLPVIEAPVDVAVSLVAVVGVVSAAEVEEAVTCSTTVVSPALVTAVVVVELRVVGLPVVELRVVGLPVVELPVVGVEMVGSSNATDMPGLWMDSPPASRL